MNGVLAFFIAFIVVFAIGMLIRYFVTKNKKPAAPPNQANAAPPPPPGQVNAAPPPPVQGNFCPNCGASNAAGAVFCTGCGTKMK